MAFSCRTTLPVINSARQNGHPLKRQFHSFKLKGKGNHNVSGRRCKILCRASEAGILGKLGRVLKEKALADYNRVFTGTSKTRESLQVVDELLTYWKLDESDDLLDELEEALLTSDFGPACSMKIVDIIREEVLAGKLKTSEDLKAALKTTLVQLLTKRAGDGTLNTVEDPPLVIMVIGVNGGGKTTSIGKLANRFSQEGAKVFLASGDTFRAAAHEQLVTWSERADATMCPYEENAKPSAVLYRAVEAAAAEDSGCDILIADTSGRLHTNSGLMDELAKCKLSMGKAMENAPHEVLLVLDGTTGLNMLNQAREFHEQIGVTGLVLTKLDGTAKGGCVVSVVDELGIPVKFVGVGEGIDDLQPFDAQAFVDALFPN